MLLLFELNGHSERGKLAISQIEHFFFIMSHSSYRQKVKIQTSLFIYKASTEPSQVAHVRYLRRSSISQSIARSCLQEGFNTYAVSRYMGSWFMLH